jgi:hypothetical protein
LGRALVTVTLPLKQYLGLRINRKSFILGAARDIYGAMYPGESFLPRAPDPEEILLGGEEDSEQQPILDETAQDQPITSGEEAPDQPMIDAQMPEQLKGTATENERD